MQIAGREFQAIVIVARFLNTLGTAACIGADQIARGVDQRNTKGIEAGVFVIDVKFKVQSAGLAGVDFVGELHRIPDRILNRCAAQPHGVVASDDQ